MYSLCVGQSRFSKVYKKLVISGIVSPIWLIVLVYENRIYPLLSLNFHNIKTHLLDVFMGRELSLNLAAVVNYTFALDHVTLKTMQQDYGKRIQSNNLVYVPLQRVSFFPDHFPSPPHTLAEVPSRTYPAVTQENLQV